VRHLLLPEHFDCCFLPILDWCAAHIPEAMFSFRDGYLPAWQAKNDPVLRSYPDPQKVLEAQELVRQRMIHWT
jgi:uncharacterized Fe-S radical SAM superfamily protein PflX